VPVLRCVFVNNEARYQGGAVFGDSAIDSCLLLGNRAAGSGGAVAGSMYRIAACTLVRNAAPNGSAISLYNARPVITNSIFWDNPASHGGVAIRAVDSIGVGRFSGNLIQDGLVNTSFTGVPPNFETPTFIGDPQFIRPLGPPSSVDQWQGSNYRLRPTSPAIGVGSRSGAAWSDRDGRRYDSIYDARSPDAGCYFVTRSDCIADLDRSWPFLVDDSDFQLFAAAYDLTIAPPANPLADLNNDGLVDDADFSLFAVAYDALVCP